MKVRNGFVSNSSSSSFVCEICHNADTIYDGGLSEINMCECQKGHIICLDHLLDKNAELDDDHLMPQDACPICQMVDMPDHIFISYLEKRTGITREAMLKDAKSKFKNIKELEKYLGW